MGEIMVRHGNIYEYRVLKTIQANNGANNLDLQSLIWLLDTYLQMEKHFTLWL